MMQNTERAVSINCQMPAGLLARLDDLRHARQRQSTRAISRSELLREAVDAFVRAATPAPATPPPPGMVRVRKRTRAA